MLTIYLESGSEINMPCCNHTFSKIRNWLHNNNCSEEEFIEFGSNNNKDTFLRLQKNKIIAIKYEANEISAKEFEH